MGFESVLSTTTENVGTQCPDNRVNENQCFYCLDTKEVLSVAENVSTPIVRQGFVLSSVRMSPSQKPEDFGKE